MGNGLVELDRAVDSIHVGRRHRRDMGDLDALAASIQQLGLLVPITVTPDGVLVCGARRLAAVRKLGWHTVNVWVRSGISSQLEQLLSERDENALRKQLAPTEAAALYAELKMLMTEDAARRQAATRFGADAKQRRSDGAAIVAAPSGDTRTLAARAITGRDSYTSLERITEMQHIAADPGLPETLRVTVAEEIEAMNADGNIAGHYNRVKAAAATIRLERLTTDTHAPKGVRDQASRELSRLDQKASSSPAEQAMLAERALTRAKQATKRRHAGAEDAPARDRTPRRLGTRAFLLLLEDVHDWTEHYDPDEIGPALSDEQWSSFEATVTASVRFADRARHARSAHR